LKIQLIQLRTLTDMGGGERMDLAIMRPALPNVATSKNN
jgi:hypothetical protein